MADTIGNLSVILGANISPFTSGFSRATGVMTSFAGGVVGIGAKLAKFGLVAGAAGAAAGLGFGIKLASDFEQTEVAITTMLGSAAKAKELLGDLQDFAASTPFEFPEIAKSSKMLLAFGFAADSIKGNLKNIGDVAAGIGAPLGELAELYGKAKTQGTLMAEDINQLTGRGIPIIGELAKQFGIAESEVKGLVSEGKVGFANLEEAFASMAGEGGQFAGLMDKQSKTLTGLLSTLKDNIGRTAMEIGQSFLAMFNVKDGIAGLIGGISSARERVVGIASGIFETVGPYIQAFVGMVQSNWGIVQGLLSSGYSWLTGLVGSIVGVVQPKLKGIFTNVIGYWQGVWGATSAIGGAIYGFVTGVLSSLGLQSSGTFGKIIDAAGWMQQKVTMAFNLVEFSIENFKSVFQLGLLGAALGVVRLGSEIHHHFAVRIPALLSWFSDNWFEVFLTIGANTLTFFENLGGNIVEVFKTIPKLLKGETVNWGDVFTPLSDGFLSVIKELPDIPAREIGPIEQSLRGEVGALQAVVGGDLEQFLEQKRMDAEGVAGSIFGGFEALAANADALRFDKDNADALATSTQQSDQIAAGALGGSKTANQSPELVEAGTSAAMAFQREFLKASAGDGKDKAQKETADNTKKTAEGVSSLVDLFGVREETTAIIESFAGA